MDHHEHSAHDMPTEAIEGTAPGHYAEHDMPAAEHDMHAAGHDRHAGHSVAMFRDKFWLSLALTIPVILLSHDVAGVVRLHESR